MLNQPSGLSELAANPAIRAVFDAALRWSFWGVVVVAGLTFATTWLIPVAHNAGWLWPKGLFGKRPGTVTISFGPPIAAAGKDAQRLTAEVETWIEDEVARLGVPS